MKFYPNLLVVLALCLYSCNSEDLPTVRVTAESTHSVNDHLFGHFLEKCSWDGEIGADLLIDPLTGEPYPQLMKKLASLEIPSLRFPGGTDVDYYPWTNLIDQAPGQQSRKPYRNRKSGEVFSDNRLGLHEFVQVCRQLDAEPIYVVNLGAAYYKQISMDSAVTLVKGLIEYCNKLASEGPIDWVGYRKANGSGEPFSITYFQLGNEPWLFKELSKSIAADDPQLKHYVSCVKTLAAAMKGVDPSIKIITDGEMKGFMTHMEEDEELQALVDELAFHRYEPWGIKEIMKYDTLLVDAKDLSEREIWNAWVATPHFDTLNGQANLKKNDTWRRAVALKKPIAMTEWNWNGWFQGPIVQEVAINPTYAKGIGAAGFLHAFIRSPEIKMASQSMLLGQSWGITSLRVNPDQMPSSAYLPTGLVTGFYSRFHGNKYLPVELENIPSYNQPYKMQNLDPYPRVAYLDVVATESADSIFVHVINRHFSDSIKTRVIVDQALQGSQVTLHEFRGDPKGILAGNPNLHLNEGLKDIAKVTSRTFARPDDGIYVFPPHSVTVLMLPAKD